MINNQIVSVSISPTVTISTSSSSSASSLSSSSTTMTMTTTTTTTTTTTLTMKKSSTIETNSIDSGDCFETNNPIDDTFNHRCLKSIVNESRQSNGKQIKERLRFFEQNLMKENPKETKRLDGDEITQSRNATIISDSIRSVANLLNNINVDNIVGVDGNTAIYENYQIDLKNDFRKFHSQNDSKSAPKSIRSLSSLASSSVDEHSIVEDDQNHRYQSTSQSIEKKVNGCKQANGLNQNVPKIDLDPNGSNLDRFPIDLDGDNRFRYPITNQQDLNIDFDSVDNDQNHHLDYHHHHHNLTHRDHFGVETCDGNCDHHSIDSYPNHFLTHHHHHHHLDHQQDRFGVDDDDENNIGQDIFTTDSKNTLQYYQQFGRNISDDYLVNRAIVIDTNIVNGSIERFHPNDGDYQIDIAIDGDDVDDDSLMISDVNDERVDHLNHYQNHHQFDLYTVTDSAYNGTDSTLFASSSHPNPQVFPIIETDLGAIGSIYGNPLVYSLHTIYEESENESSLQTLSSMQSLEYHHQHQNHQLSQQQKSQHQHQEREYRWESKNYPINLNEDGYYYDDELDSNLFRDQKNQIFYDDDDGGDGDNDDDDEEEEKEKNDDRIRSNRNKKDQSSQGVPRSNSNLVDDIAVMNESSDENEEKDATLSSKLERYFTSGLLKAQNDSNNFNRPEPISIDPKSQLNLESYSKISKQFDCERFLSKLLIDMLCWFHNYRKNRPNLGISNELLLQKWTKSNIFLDIQTIEELKIVLTNFNHLVQIDIRSFIVKMIKFWNENDSLSHKITDNETKSLEEILYHLIFDHRIWSNIVKELFQNGNNPMLAKCFDPKRSSRMIQIVNVRINGRLLASNDQRSSDQSFVDKVTENGDGKNSIKDSKKLPSLITILPVCEQNNRNRDYRTILQINDEWNTSSSSSRSAMIEEQAKRSAQEDFIGDDDCDGPIKENANRLTKFFRTSNPLNRSFLAKISPSSKSNTTIDTIFPKSCDDSIKIIQDDNRFENVCRNESKDLSKKFQSDRNAKKDTTLDHCSSINRRSNAGVTKSNSTQSNKSHHPNLLNDNHRNNSMKQKSQPTIHSSSKHPPEFDSLHSLQSNDFVRQSRTKSLCLEPYGIDDRFDDNYRNDSIRVHPKYIDQIEDQKSIDFEKKFSQNLNEKILLRSRSNERTSSYEDAKKNRSKMIKCHLKRSLSGSNTRSISYSSLSTIATDGSCRLNQSIQSYSSFKRPKSYYNSFDIINGESGLASIKYSQSQSQPTSQHLTSLFTSASFNSGSIVKDFDCNRKTILLSSIETESKHKKSSNSKSKIVTNCVPQTEIGKICLSIYYETKLGSLTITIFRCCLNSIKKNKNEFYVKVYLMTTHNNQHHQSIGSTKLSLDEERLLKKKTKIKKSIKNDASDSFIYDIEFNEILRFNGKWQLFNHSYLSISLWNNDTFGRNTLQGQLLLKLDERIMLNSIQTRSWHNLTIRNKTKRLIFDLDSAEYFDSIQIDSSTLIKSIENKENRNGSIFLAIKFDDFNYDLNRSMRQFRSNDSQRNEKNRGNLSILIKGAEILKPIDLIGQCYCKLILSGGNENLERRQQQQQQIKSPCSSSLSFSSSHTTTSSSTSSSASTSFPVSRKEYETIETDPIELNVRNLRWNQTIKFNSINLDDLLIRKRLRIVIVRQNKQTKIDLGHVVLANKNASSNEAKNLWQQMIDRPNLWAYGNIPLRD
ncbi:P protein-like [Sarcoptes scabiei]|nr:P protein-like [Sarcoptes scabiei]